MIERQKGIPGLVSIGVPVYNGAVSIASTLDSILAQHYPKIEVLISDNASTDNTFDIVSDYAERHNNITLVRQADNIGIVANFMAVFEMSRGEFFIWHAADDRWASSAMGRLVGELEAYPECGLVMSATERLRPDGTVHDVIRYQEPYDPNTMSYAEQAKGLVTIHQEVLSLKLNLFICGLFRRALLKSIFKANSDIFYCGDRVVPAIAAIASGLRYVDECLFYKVVQPTSFHEREPDDPYTKRKMSQSYQVLTMSLLKTLMRIPEVTWQRRIGAIPFFLPLLYMSARGELGKLKRTIFKLYSL
ncbi:glycosyltransferase family 2 protein [Pseudodesulfovibrio pelocollis]|uniref:glycosyltransferase family 2 protein n=1 Tax=Pseudodesulfovibrio pelocollis TaxID=3051432 RepID=UPI00255AA611|nr:glycosyltransferase family 2 protein [Pseudodesulfovibrio sp. SB368]